MGGGAEAAQAQRVAEHEDARQRHRSRCEHRRQQQAQRVQRPHGFDRTGIVSRSASATIAARRPSMATACAQLRQASPLVTVVPEEVRKRILQQVRDLKAGVVMGGALSNPGDEGSVQEKP